MFLKGKDDFFQFFDEGKFHLQFLPNLYSPLSPLYDISNEKPRSIQVKMSLAKDTAFRKELRIAGTDCELAPWQLSNKRRYRQKH